MNRPARRFVLLLTLALLSWTGRPAAQGDTTTEPDIVLAALYRSDVETEYMRGIQEALAKHPLGGRVHVDQRPYGDEDTAFDTLKLIFEEQQADIVLGPADSGVFLRTVKELGDHPNRVPVLAPLVAATIEFDPEGAFFPTNASLQRRAQRMADTLSKYWLRSIAVLHPKSQFGQLSEAAFSNAYQLLQPKAVYRSFQYETAVFDARTQVDHILRDRPEALGIFGTRKEISAICDLLVEMNTTLTPYRPILFSPIDYRQPDLKSGELLITTVVPELGMNDVHALTHDNVLMILDQVLPGQAFAEQKGEVLQRIGNVLRGTRPVGSEHYLTPMAFTGGHNQSTLHVLEAKDGSDAVPVHTPGFLGRMTLKVTLLWRTVGAWPIINLLIIMLIPTFFSIVDLKRWYEGRLRTLLVSFHAGLFVVFNVFVVVVLYMYLAETGKIPYESTLTAIIIAMAPTTLVRSTFFNTPTGKAIGLASLYENFLKWLNARLMLKKYRRRQKYVNIVAYFNTLESMKQELYQIYDNSREEDMRASLRAKLEQDLEEAASNLDKRFVCARRLLTRLNWRVLESMGYVPADESLQGRTPADPDLVVKIATRYVREHPDRRAKLNEEVERVLTERPDASLPPGEGGGKTYPRVRLLVQYGFFTPKRLVAAGFLPETWRESTLLGEAATQPKQVPQTA